MLVFRMNHAAEKWRNVTARAFVTSRQMPSLALRDRASSSATTRASPIAVPAGSFAHSAKNFAGVTCQESPYLSASHPHCTSFPPPAVSFSQSRGRGIDLLLRVAVDHERDGFGELELPRKLSGFKAVNSCSFSSNETVMTWPFFSGNSSPV